MIGSSNPDTRYEITGEPEPFAKWADTARQVANRAREIVNPRRSFGRQTGGTRSPLGTFVSALLIGQVRTLGAVYLPSLASTLPLILMGAVLAIRPHGLSETAR